MAENQQLPLQPDTQESDEEAHLDLSSNIPENALNHYYNRSVRDHPDEESVHKPRQTPEAFLRQLQSMEARRRREMSEYQKELRNQRKYTWFMILFVLVIAIVLLCWIKIQADRLEDARRNHNKYFGWFTGRFAARRILVLGATGFGLGYGIKKVVEYVTKSGSVNQVVTVVHLFVPVARQYIPVAVEYADGLFTMARHQLGF